MSAFEMRNNTRKGSTLRPIEEATAMGSSSRLDVHGIARKPARPLATLLRRMLSSATNASPETIKLTHFMNEAARCDRIALMDAGRVLKTGTPAELIAARGVATLEEAFISYLKEAEAARAPDAEIMDDAAKALTTPQIQANEEPSPLFS